MMDMMKRIEEMGIVPVVVIGCKTGAASGRSAVRGRTAVC